MISFGYKASGELQTVTNPGSVVRTLAYNDDGDLTGDQLIGVAGAFPSLPAATVRNATYTFDARGLLKTGADLARFLQQDAATYSGLGYLTQSGLHQNWVNGWGLGTVYGVTETFQTDALGNQVAHSTVDSAGNSAGWTSTTTPTGPYRYNQVKSQLDSLSGHAYQYDGAGNQEWEVSMANFERASYYDAANRLRRTDLRTYSTFAQSSGTRTVEDYRYDALGRRVWVWTQTECKAPSQFRACIRSHVKRTIWDGAALLAEIQAPGDTAQQAKWEQDTGGYNVAYQHVVSPPYNDLDYDPNPYFGQVVYSSGVIDQPLSVTRYNYTDRPVSTTTVKVWPTFTYFPHWDRRGVPTLGTFADGKWYKQFTTGAGGTGQSCFATPGFVIDTTGTRCVIMHWPASQSAYDQRHQKTPVETWAWQGSLVEDQRDGSGWSYRRARVFDPTTGRFTQVDPVGVAGGLNLYGFAGGDPVNFSDPFGLWPGEVHDAILLAALGGGNPDLAFLQSASRLFDFWTQWTAMSSWHAMRAPNQSPSVAKAENVQMVANGLSNAFILERAGDHRGAMRALAASMHAVMDRYSPAHRDVHGNPLPWQLSSGPSEWEAHAAAESRRPTPAEMATMVRILNVMYWSVIEARKKQD